MNEVGIRLGQALYSRGMSQRELAEKLGVSHSTVSCWCCNGNWMSARFLPGICKALNVSADWLLFGKDAERKTQI